MVSKESINELRKLGKIEREKKMNDLHDEQLLLRSKNAMGGSLDNPSRIRTIRRTIARIETINREEELKIRVSNKK